MRAPAVRLHPPSMLPTVAAMILIILTVLVLLLFVFVPRAS